MKQRVQEAQGARTLKDYQINRIVSIDVLDALIETFPPEILRLPNPYQNSHAQPLMRKPMTINQETRTLRNASIASLIVIFVNIA